LISNSNFPHAGYIKFFREQNDWRVLAIVCSVDGVYGDEETVVGIAADADSVSSSLGTGDAKVVKTNCWG